MQHVTTGIEELTAGGSCSALERVCFNANDHVQSVPEMSGNVKTEPENSSAEDDAQPNENCGTARSTQDNQACCDDRPTVACMAKHAGTGLPPACCM